MIVYVVGKARQNKLEGAAGHTESIIRKQKMANVYTQLTYSFFYSFWVLSPWNGVNHT